MLVPPQNKFVASNNFLAKIVEFIPSKLVKYEDAENIFTHFYKTTIYQSTTLTLYLGIYHCLPTFSQESEPTNNYTTFLINLT